jgi:Family of unknown function (DUF6428)
MLKEGIAQMLIPAKNEFAPPAPGDGEITIGPLLGALASHGERPLVFFYDGRPVKAGYHVTEVKAGAFSALDCGANPEAWTEIFIQLWDVEEGGRQHMAAGKFATIIRKVAEHVELEDTARLTFEVSDGERPMQLYRAGEPEIVGDQVNIVLAPRPASCKPRDRWLAEQDRRGVDACCASASQSCCR